MMTKCQDFFMKLVFKWEFVQSKRKAVPKLARKALASWKLISKKQRPYQNGFEPITIRWIITGFQPD